MRRNKNNHFVQLFKNLEYKNVKLFEKFERKIGI